MLNVEFQIKKQPLPSAKLSSSFKIQNPKFATPSRPHSARSPSSIQNPKFKIQNPPHPPHPPRSQKHLFTLDFLGPAAWTLVMAALTASNPTKAVICHLP